MSKIFVANEEVLYRCVRSGRNLKALQPDGTFKLSAMAFSDPYYRPSVNRAKLCDNNPKLTQFDPKDGVVQLVTHEVRAIGTVVQNDPKGKPIKKFNIDVEHVPEPDNFSHAEIYANPEIQSKSVFRKMIESLAQLANKRPWAIELQDE